MTHSDSPPIFAHDANNVLEKIGQEKLLKMLRQMLLIRQFELRAEASYQQGKIGGFLHLYIGEEAIQTAAVEVLGPNNWYSATYRCHAITLLLGESPESMMAELFGKKSGNAQGRGGSMHMYSKRLLGGFGIVAGQLPVATGAAFTCKYLNKKDELSVCFFGDGAMAQGVFHESLNLASMWGLPCLYVIENNKWSMGTPLKRTLANYDQFPHKFAESYGARYIRLDGMDLTNCYAGFQEAKKHVLSEQKPMVIECLTDRFRGHSVSDPGLYRTKEELAKCMEQDPLLVCKQYLEKKNWLTDEKYKEMERECREQIIKAVKYADEAPWPDPKELESGVLAPPLKV